MKAIDITAAGPIDGTFSIDLSHGPGVYEFRGARGTGKTTCLSSIDWLAGHKVDITVHDGSLSSGKVEGFGVVAPIGGRHRRKGEIEANTLDTEKFSLTDILAPQGKTADVRDATRIKALAVLSDAKADQKLYYELAGGQAAFDSLGVKETDDPVALATRIKTAYDTMARNSLNTADAEAKHAAALEVVPDGLDLDGESDLNALGQKRDDARDRFRTLSSKRDDGQATEQAAFQARERLSKLRSGYSGPQVDQAERDEVAAIEKGKECNARVAELEAALDKARSALQVCTAEYQAAHKTLDAAKSHYAAISELEALASREVDYPDESEVSDAKYEVEAATAEYNEGIRRHDVKRNMDKAASHRSAEQAARKAADEAINKAAQVFTLFANSLKMKHLSITLVDGSPRLFVSHPKRGRTAFDRVNGLSDGERVDYALKELLPHIQSPGLLPIPQQVWQDLQPTDRQRLHDLAVKNSLYLFGAQVDDGNLRVVYFGNCLTERA